MPYRVLRRFPHPGLAALALVSAGPALAADLAYPLPYPEPEPGPSRVYREERIEEQLPPPPRAEPRFAPRFSAAPPPETCRVIVKRRIEEDGTEVERRIRICDDGLAEGPPPGPAFRRSGYGPPHPVPPGEVPYGPESDPRW